MQLIAGTVFCVLTVSLWRGISAVEPLPEENMNVVSVVYVIICHFKEAQVLEVSLNGTTFLPRVRKYKKITH